MAVIDNVEVTISSRHNALQEFPVPMIDHPGGDNGDHPSCTKIVKCYIEAVPGANFEINYSIKGGQTFRNSIMESQTSEDVDYLSFNTWVDGRRVLAPIVEPERLQHADETPSATVDDIKARYGKIGSIRVEFSRQKRLRVTRQFEPVSLNEGPVPEKAIKGQALDLGVGLQHARPMHKSLKVHQGEIVDDGPLAVFIFLYRSKNALQILGVLPRTPEPEAVEDKPIEEIDPTTLSRAEMLELIRQQQAELEATRSKVKKEKAAPDMRRLGTIKREATDEDEDDLTVAQGPRKRVHKEDNVIDLTDD